MVPRSSRYESKNIYLIDCCGSALLKEKGWKQHNQTWTGSHPSPHTGTGLGVTYPYHTNFIARACGPWVGRASRGDEGAGRKTQPESPQYFNCCYCPRPLPKKKRARKQTWLRRFRIDRERSEVRVVYRVLYTLLMANGEAKRTAFLTRTRPVATDHPSIFRAA